MIDCKLHADLSLNTDFYKDKMHAKASPTILLRFF